MAVEILESGILQWSATQDYLAGARVQRSRRLWRATVATGPGTGNATDPALGGQVVWARVTGVQNEPAAVVLTGVAGVSRVDLAWVAPDDGGSAILRYEVQWRTTSQAWSATRQASTTDLTHARTGLNNGTTYHHRVRAVNAIGTGPWSNIAGPDAPGDRPGGPRQPDGHRARIRRAPGLVSRRPQWLAGQPPTWCNGKRPGRSTTPAGRPRPPTCPSLSRAWRSPNSTPSASGRSTRVRRGRLVRRGHRDPRPRRFRDRSPGSTFAAGQPLRAGRWSSAR